MTKKVIGLLLGVLLALPNIGSAQIASVVQRPIYVNWDLDSTSDVAGSFGPEVPAEGRTVATSGSSATTTSTNAAFSNVVVGDVIWVSVPASCTNAGLGSTRTPRLVTAKASDNSVTVNAAWDLCTTGRSLRYQKFTSGASAGWIPVDGASIVMITSQIDQMAVSSGGIRMKIEGQYSIFADSASSVLSPVNLWPGEAGTSTQCGGGTFTSGYCVYTAAGTATRINFTTAGVTFPTFIRLVAAFTGTDDGGDLTTNLEQINATVTTVLR